MWFVGFQKLVVINVGSYDHGIELTGNFIIVCSKIGLEIRTSTTFVDNGATSNTCIWISGAEWLSGRVLDLGSKGH